MYLRLKLILVILIFSFKNSQSQSKDQIAVLNTLVKYIQIEENIDTVPLILPCKQLQKGEPFRHNSYKKLPIDSTSITKFTRRMPKQMRDIWPKLTLANTRVLTKIQQDSILVRNLKNLFANNKSPDSCKYSSIGFSTQIGIYSWYNFSNPVFTPDHKYALVRLFYGALEKSLSDYKYYLFYKENDNWIVLKGFGGGHLCW